MPARRASHLLAEKNKIALCDKCCAVSKVNDFEKLCELISLEAFKGCMPDKLIIHLNEQKVGSLVEAALLADGFILMHETGFSLVVRSKRSPVPIEHRYDCILAPLQYRR